MQGEYCTLLVPSYGNAAEVRAEMEVTTTVRKSC